ncbi:NifU family protein [Ferrimicrobium acidiphilum]|uniref:Fe/S biogenesis protein NfuA n=1 Tax=Ferrimicrobium acidiphilum DSM 19497 TaxID=1121877 RepID=A0A0D8FQ83_9ACTN|nr:NifU family protein [Ferrimicrobium acidiphilum]KJE75296.1 Fe/S biogenesis protein NfuA [Ferrimicrobium acidiphilum DSM 19497]
MSNTDQERRAQLEALLAKLRPAVQADGGDLYLASVDTDSGEVVVGLSGACSSCAISTTTVKLGVERILKAKLPWVTSVEGDLDTSMDFEESASLGTGAYVPISIRKN